ncbi:MAG: MFS transporter [Elusimicrobia bacterium]|nr:MFS transporter [Elusimicrobiota bacterium]
MTRGKVRASVAASIKDGLAWAAMSGLVEPYVVPFALALGASAPFVGFLRAAPPLAASAAQLLNEEMVRRLGSCRRAVRLDVLAQASSLFAAAAAVVLPPRGALLLLAAALVLYTTAGNLAGPPWATLMGEYIPRRRRGAFFGLRNQIVGVTFFSASLAAARLLSFYPGLWTFSALFAAAGLLRLLSFHYIGGMYEPASGFHLPRTPSAAEQPASPPPALRPFLASVFALMFSSFLVAPYFSVYVLTHLRYGYLRYMVIMTIGQLVTYLLMRRWGGIADLFGSVKVLRAAFLSVPLIPLLWALAPSFWWLVCAEVFSGTVWAAYGMGTNNFVYELAGPARRTRYIAMFGFTACLGQFAGALAGGVLYATLRGNAFVVMLLMSACLRIGAIIPFLARVKETDMAAAARPGFLMSAIGFRSIDVYPAAALPGRRPPGRP